MFLFSVDIVHQIVAGLGEFLHIILAARVRARSRSRRGGGGGATFHELQASENMAACLPLSRH